MKYLWSGFLLLTVSMLKAQPKVPLPVPEKWALRANPMGLADVLDGNLSVGMERYLNSRWSLTTDLSFIFYSAYLPTNRRALGYIIKPALRFYTSSERSLFMEISFFYKRCGYKVKDWLGKDCVNDVPAYEKYETFIFSKRVTGINVQAGWRRDLTRNKLWRMELYIGLGIRRKWQDVRGDPMDCYQTNSVFNTEINQTTFIGGSLPHGLRVIYTIQ